MVDEPRIVLPGIGEAIRSVNALVGCVHSLSPADQGLFGPRSVSWMVFREPGYGISALAGLLLQALHPVAMAAIDQHSDYRRDAWRRGHRTAEYIFTITFSARETALRAAERVRSIHERVAGTDPVTGRDYRADDSDLLLWIHNAGTEMVLRGQQAFGGPLSLAEADRFVAEQVLAASLVGLEDRVPTNREALRAWVERAPLRLTPAAAEFARLLLGARMPIAMRPFWAMHVAGAVSLLPPEARQLYAFPKWALAGSRLRPFIRFALRTMDLCYGAFGPIRRARRHLGRISRAQPSSAA